MQLPRGGNRAADAVGYCSTSVTRFSEEKTVKSYLQPWKRYTDYGGGFFMSFLRAPCVTLFAAVVLMAQTPSPAPSAAAGASVVGFVPFGDPATQSTAQKDATRSAISALQSQHFTVQELPVMDHVEAATTASALCANYKLTAVALGSFTYDQSFRTNGLAYVPIVGLFATATGAYKRTPTKVHLTTDIIGCDGKVLFTERTDGDKTGNGNNSGAAITGAFEDAFAKVLAELEARNILTQGAAAMPSAQPSEIPW
jgi:hypothetical protein